MSNATVFQGFQIGKEGTAGTAVTAAKRILGMSIAPGLAVNHKVFRPAGQKFNTFGGTNTLWAQATFDGELDYNTLAYVLAGLVKRVTATGTAAPYTWGTHISDPNGPDTIDTFSVQCGVTGAPVWKWAYGVFTGLKLTFDQSGGKVNANMIGKSITNVLVTATGTMDTVTATISPLVSLAHHSTLYATSTYANLNSSSIGYRKFEWGLEDKAGPAFYVKGTSDWTDHVELPPKNTIKMTLEWNATTAAWLTEFKAGTTMYYKHAATDATNSLTIVGAALITNISWGNEDGIAVVTLDMEGQTSSNISSGGVTAAPFKIDLINGISAL